MKPFIVPPVPERQVVSGVVCFEVFSVWKGKDPTSSVKMKEKEKEQINILAIYNKPI